MRPLCTRWRMAGKPSWSLDSWCSYSLFSPSNADFRQPVLPLSARGGDTGSYLNRQLQPRAQRQLPWPLPQPPPAISRRLCVGASLPKGCTPPAPLLRGCPREAAPRPPWFGVSPRPWDRTKGQSARPVSRGLQGRPGSPGETVLCDVHQRTTPGLVRLDEYPNP